MPQPAPFAEFVADIEPGLRRALADEFGAEAGREATVDALAFAYANWERVISSPDPEAYLVQVGQTAAERHLPDVTGDVTVILPRSQAGFDAVVPPVGDAEAVQRASELAGGAPATTALPRTVAVGGATARMAATAPGMAMPREPRTRRTAPWVVTAVLVGVLALGGIALANRSGGGDLDPVESTSLPTLPTTIDVVTSLPQTLPPSTTQPPTTVPPATAPPVSDTLPEIFATATNDDSGDDSGSDDDGSGNDGTGNDGPDTETTENDDEPVTTADDDGDGGGDTTEATVADTSADTAPESTAAESTAEPTPSSDPPTESSTDTSA